MEEYSGGAAKRSCSGGMTTMDDEIVSQEILIITHQMLQSCLEAEKITTTIKRKAMESAQPIPCNTVPE